MHYIRFCRPPEVQPGRSHASVKIVLTITTDLSDSFLSPGIPIQLAVVGAYTQQKDGKSQLVPVNLIQTNPPTWRAGMRVLKLDLPLPPSQPIETIQIRPLNRQLTALSTDDVLPGAQGLIMGVYADMPRPGGGPAPSVCFRSLRLSTGDPGVVQTLQIEEDLGESIARHIWDSGIVMVSLFADLCFDSTAGTAQKKALPLLRDILSPQDRALNILELGCGVGVMGIGLARILALRQAKEQPRILMTDLPEAEQKARANIARQADASANLDFEPLDWEDGKDDRFGDQAASCAWELVALCDCTYNTDTLPPLVKTLSALHRHSATHSAETGAPVNTEVLVATKLRHSSERIFFDLMSAEGWAIREQTVLPLPMLDGEAQAVEVYLFGKQG
ncbi:putative methyltransferase-domain-containing protein [Staphylotrichum tortipilum]|uniref:Methyltransferase-domain-containing protein n=1 Tax=Staphylotrichum tortipilum TaxID=2831512 RepID=A0AAN6RSM8_9PEZI|nr:putative methyltransferase-domain-containing protein [Staphylotrichum longicolle]